MKKVFAALAAGVMASAMALSLAACAEPEKSVVERAEEMASERIGSREAWEAAFADPTLGATDTSYTFNNANYSIESESISTIGGNLGGGSRLNISSRVTRELTVAGDKLHFAQRTEMSGDTSEDSTQINGKEEYYALDESRYEYYYKDANGAWKMETRSKLGISLIETSAYTGTLTSYADSYEMFTWSDARMGYYLPVTIKGLLDVAVNATLTLKFREGKIAAMLISDAAVDPDAATDGLLLTDIAASVQVGVIVTYGGRTVSLPL